MNHFTSNPSKELFRISADGVMTLGVGVTMDEAATVFQEQCNALYQAQQAEIEQLKRSNANLYNDKNSYMRKHLEKCEEADEYYENAKSKAKRIAELEKAIERCTGELGCEAWCLVKKETPRE